MKNLFKIFILISLFIISINSGFAFQTGKLDKLIKQSNLNEAATVAISVKNVENNNTVYELNSKKLLHPASTLKIFTAYAAFDTLGYEYLFKTQFYKDNQNNLYIKLGADPFLKSSELKAALKTVKDESGSSFKNLYIDDSIIDKEEFAPGWMWDDDTNPYTPKISAYNLDNNLIQVNMSANAEGLAELRPKTTYPASVFSYIKTGGKEDSIDIKRYNWNNPELTEVYGTVTSPKSFNIPISSMRRYFIHNLEKGLEELKLQITSTLYSSKIVPEDAQLITEISHPASKALPLILRNSNNLMAETVFKLAASKKYAATGSEDLACELFKEFYNKNGIETENIIIQDGSGISRKNLVSADWSTSTLNTLYKMKDFEKYKEQMAQPGEGTLSERLFDLRGDVWLKTGSLAKISTLAGYVNSQDGNTYSVTIFIENFIDSPFSIKQFENEIINIIYNQ